MRRRSHKRLLPLLGICAVAAAQPGAGQFANVSGVVTNSVTGQPILRAHVVLSPVNSGTEIYGALSDAGGKFSILRVPPGSYNVQADRVGHLRGNMEAITLHGGDEKSDLKLSLTPAGSITGRVVDSDGEPLEGVSVQIVGGTAGNTSTDDRGQFRIPEMAPGRYKVVARMSSDYFFSDIYVDGLSDDVHYGATYFPGSLDSRSAGRVVVKAGMETGGVDIRMARSPVVHISGSVIGFPAGVRNAIVHLRPMQIGDEKNGGVKPDGKFEVAGVEPGRYELYAAVHDPKQFLQTATVELEVAESNIKDLELRVVAPVTISGVVRYEDEQAKPQEHEQHPRIMLFRSSIRNMAQSGGEVHEDGSFKFEGVAPGGYLVLLSWRSGYVKSMQLGPTPIDGRFLDLSYGAGGGQLELLVSSAFAEISGRVDGAKDAQNQFVVLAKPDPPDRAQLHWRSFGADGSYRIAELPPGKYKLGVVEKDGLNPATEIDDAIEITVAAGEKATRDLRVPVVQ